MFYGNHLLCTALVKPCTLCFIETIDLYNLIETMFPLFYMCHLLCTALFKQCTICYIETIHSVQTYWNIVHYVLLKLLLCTLLKYSILYENIYFVQPYWNSLHCVLWKYCSLFSFLKQCTLCYIECTCVNIVLQKLETIYSVQPLNIVHSALTVKFSVK